MSINIYNHRQHAIVMGASLGGLLTARVLSKHFKQVTILEKDPVNLKPESRKGQPQTRHLHGLLATGMSVMTNYFPDLPQALTDNGAVMIDFADTMQWYIYGGYRKRFPKGYLVLGDAISSFNPTYGQGMTVAALQAAELDKVLGENQEIDRLAQTFFKRVAKVIDIPWQLAVGEDFRFPQTTGSKPLGTDFINHYVSRIHQATLRDKIVCEVFLKVMNLMEPPASLFNPRIIWRVLMA